jgi:hypothetical protein
MLVILPSKPGRCAWGSSISRINISDRSGLSNGMRMVRSSKISGSTFGIGGAGI